MASDRKGRLLLLLLAVPFVLLPGFGYDGLRLPVALALGAVLVGLHGLGRLRGALPLAVLAFAAAHLLALPGVIDPWAAGRSLMVPAAGLGAFFAVRAGAGSRKEAADAVLAGVPAAGLALALVGLADLLFVSGERAVGLEGNTNYSGTLCAMLIAPAAAAAVTAGPSWRRILGAVSGLAQAVMLVATQSRGGALGLVAAVAVLCVILLRVRCRRSAVIVAVLSLAVVGTTFARGSARSARATSPVVRMEIWRSAAGMFSDRPWLGGGPGQFFVRYPPYRTGIEYGLSNPDPSAGFVEVEDAHSSWVQIAVETGMPGILSWLALIGIAAWRWRRASFGETSPEGRLLLAALGGGAAAYLVSGCFNTLTVHVSHTVCFWAFLALIEPSGERTFGVAARLCGAAVLLAASGFAMMTGLSDRSLNRAMQTADPGKRREGIDEALSWQGSSWRALFQRGTVTTDPPAALRYYRRSTALRPWHAPSLANAGIAAVRSGDEAGGRTLLERAAEAAPYWHVPHYNLGLLEARAGRLEEARRRFVTALARYPDHGESHYSLGEILLLRNEHARAVVHFLKARDRGIPVKARLRAERPGVESNPAYVELFR